jgi:hypothetical protein
MIADMETDDLDRELAAQLGGLGVPDGYRVERVLKQGGDEQTQLVYLVAQDGREHGPLVRKIIRDKKGLGGAYETVRAAQRRGTRLVHLPRIYECTHADGYLTVVMEHVGGATLGTCVGRLDTPEARLSFVHSWFPDLCDAVSELHTCCDAPVIHRDLKPSNVMVTAGGIVLIDLGISRTFKEDADRDTARFGTLAYAPPEQFGFGQTSVRSDVYALGMLLFFCLTGREASSRDRTSGFAGSGVSSALRRVIERATQFDPSARYATALLFKEALIAAFEGEDAGGSEAGAFSFVASSFDPGADTVTVDASGASRPSLLARVPRLFGLVWDVLVVAACALFVASCVSAYASADQAASYPAWYLIFTYLFCLLPLILIASYLLLDRRPLRPLIPALSNLTVRRETTRGLKAIALIFGVWILATTMEAFLAGWQG